MTFIDLKDIHVSYNGKQDIPKDSDISMGKEELVFLLGPSGCGKMTTLRVTAGLIKPDDGQLLVDQGELTEVPVHKRNFGMVFQSHALSPHLAIAENVAFGLKLHKEGKRTMDQEVMGMLKVYGLESLGDRYPEQLSGSQGQQVVLTWALIAEPKLLLLGEPLSNLDAKLRMTTRIEIKRVQQRLDITVVFVTCDQGECFPIPDKVAIMNNGVVEQYDSPETIYRLPCTRFVAGFIGFENLFSIEKMEAGHYQTQTDQIVKTTNPEPNVTTTVTTIRPEDIKIVSKAATSTVAGTVVVRIFLGKSYRYEVETALGTLLVSGTSEQLYETNETVRLAFPVEKLVILEK